MAIGFPDGWDYESFQDISSEVEKLAYETAGSISAFYENEIVSEKDDLGNFSEAWLSEIVCDGIEHVFHGSEFTDLRDQLSELDQLICSYSCFRASLKMSAEVSYHDFDNYVNGLHAHDLALRFSEAIASLLLYALTFPGKQWKSSKDLMRPMTGDSKVLEWHLSPEDQAWITTQRHLEHIASLVVRERFSVLSALGFEVKPGSNPTWSVERPKAFWKKHFDISDTTFREWVTTGKIKIDQRSTFSKSCRISLETLNQIKPLS